MGLLSLFQKKISQEQADYNQNFFDVSIAKLDPSLTAQSHKSGKFSSGKDNDNSSSSTIALHEDENISGDHKGNKSDGENLANVSNNHFYSVGLKKSDAVQIKSNNGIGTQQNEHRSDTRLAQKYVKEERLQIDSKISAVEQSIVVSSPQSNEAALPAIANISLGRAEVYIKQRKWEKAIEACNRALSLYPHLAAAHKLRGNVLQYMGEPADAMGCYIEALVLKPDYPEVYANLGTLYGTLDDWEKAIHYYEKAIELDAGFVGAYKHLAKAWKKLNKPDDHVDSIYRAISLSPETFTVEEHCEMADRLLNQNQEKEAIECLNRALQQDGSNAIAHQMLAQILERQGDFEQAVAHYTKVLELDRKRVPLLTSQQSLDRQKSSKVWPPVQKRTYSDQKPRQLSRKSSHSRQNINIQPSVSPTESVQKANQDKALEESTESLVVLARSYKQHGNIEKAIAHYKNALQLNPNKSDIYIELADILLQAGQSAQALESQYRAVVLGAEQLTPTRCVEIGDRLLAQNKANKALKCYRQSLQFDPSFTPAHIKIKALLDQGQSDQIEVSKALVPTQEVSSETSINGSAVEQNQPDSASLAMNLHEKGEDLAKQERWDEAVTAYGQAIELNPRFSWSYHNLGTCLSKLRKWDEAIAAYRKEIQLNPSNEWAHYHLAEAYSKQWNWHEAVQSFKSFLSIMPDNANGYDRLGDALRHIGDSEEAESSYRRALVLNSGLMHVQEKLSSLKAERLENNLEGSASVQQRDITQDTYNLIEAKDLERNLEGQISKSERLISLIEEFEEASSRLETVSTLGINTLNIEAGFPLSPEQGFYQAEYGEFGQQFRWTGPTKRFHFEVLVNRDVPLNLHLHLMKDSLLINVDGLRCFVDGVEISLVRKVDASSQGHNGIELIGTIPASHHSQYTYLEFRVPSLVPLSEIYPGVDNRLIGVAFSMLEISK